LMSPDEISALINQGYQSIFEDEEDRPVPIFRRYKR